MALKQATKDRLKAFGIDFDALKKAMDEANEVDFALPDGELMTDDQKTARDNVKIAEGKTAGIKEGEKNAIVIARKELKEAGVELTDDPLGNERWGKIATQIKEMSKITPDDKMKAYQQQNELLLKDNETLKKKATDAESALSKGIFELETISKLPGVAPGLKSLQETHQLMKMRGYETEKTDTGSFIKKNGEYIKDPTTHAPLPYEAAIKTVYDAEKWNTPAAAPTGGRGAGQKAPTGTGTSGIMNRTQAMEAFKEQFPEDNILSERGQAFYAECAKAEGFNMNE